MENKILELLQSMQNQMNSMQSDITSIKYDQLKVNERLTNLETKVDNLTKTSNLIYEQTANLTEFRTEVNDKLENLKELKAVTKENCYEIAKIKANK